MRRQRGAALLVILMILGVAGAYFALSALGQSKQKSEREAKTAAALARAKEALLAWSITQGGTPPARPGNLPCPDTNAPGTLNSGNQAATCAAGAIGRLPWKTLGIDELRDGNGELLWYALSGNFRRAGGLNNSPINSDTTGTLLLYASNGTSLLTPTGGELAAVIFAPGSPLTGQDRSGGGVTQAINYLDSANGRNNAVPNGPFIAGPVKDASGNVLVNDAVIGLSAQELIAAIEKLALREAQNALNQFFLDNGNRFPNPALSSCTQVITDVTSPNTCDSNPGVCFGRLPEDVLGPFVQTWFQQNGWGRVMTYAVNRNVAVDGTAGECSPTLSVDGGTPRNYVLIAPGTARNGVLRPSPLLANYLEDTGNRDAWNSGAAGQASFVTPTATANDQLRSQP